MWEKSNIIVNSFYSPVPPTGEHTYPFLFFSVCQKSFSEEVGGGVHCVSPPKNKKK